MKTKRQLTIEVDTLATMYNLILDLGRAVRHLDEGCKYEELWTQDGDYQLNDSFEKIAPTLKTLITRQNMSTKRQKVCHCCGVYTEPQAQDPDRDTGYGTCKKCSTQIALDNEERWKGVIALVAKSLKIGRAHV